MLKPAIICKCVQSDNTKPRDNCIRQLGSTTLHDGTAMNYSGELSRYEMHES